MAQQSEYRKPSGRPPMRLGSLMIRIAAVLLCLVMISFHLMGSMFARYTTSGNGSDDARVAKFDVEITGTATENVKITYAVTEGGVYTIEVENQSEVAVKYDIIVKIDTPWPHITPALGQVVDGVTNPLVSASTSGDGTFTFSNVGTLPVYTGAANVNTYNLGICVDWDKWTTDNWVTFTQSASENLAEAVVNFTVTIHVEQVD